MSTSKKTASKKEAKPTIRDVLRDEGIRSEAAAVLAQIEGLLERDIKPDELKALVEAVRRPSSALAVDSVEVATTRCLAESHSRSFG